MQKFAVTRTVALLGLALALVACDQQQQAADADPNDPVLATVNGSPIYRSDLRAYVETEMPDFRGLPIEPFEDRLIGNLIERRLVSQAARGEGLDLDPEVKRNLLAAEERVLSSTYLLQNIETQLTDERLQSGYEKYVAGFDGDEVLASHILVSTEEEAQQIIAALLDGGDFAALAAEHSLDTGNKDNGGDLGWFDRNTMVEPFTEAVFALEKGTYTPAPVSTQFGFHVILLVDRRSNPVPSFEDAFEAVRLQEVEAIYGTIIDSLTSKAVIERPQAEQAESPEEVLDVPAE